MQNINTLIWRLIVTKKYKKCYENATDIPQNSILLLILQLDFNSENKEYIVGVKN